MKPFRLVYLVSHPIQYQAPLLRRIAADPAFDLTVLFGSDFSSQTYQDRGFGAQVAWDVPLLDGYRSEVLPSLRDTRSVSFTSPISSGIARRLEVLQPDALWIHGYASVNALAGIVAASRLKIPVLLRAESWLADRERSSLKLAAKRLFFRALASRIAAVLSIGTHNASYWRHYLPTVPQFLVPYAVDNDWFAKRADEGKTRSRELRVEFNIGPERPLVLFASKLQERKHADHLLDAFTALLRLHADPARRPFLLIVGEGAQRTRLSAQVAALGVQADVAFAGFRNQTELPGFFAAASIFVLPSRHEAWGLVVNEALACGCPVVVSSDAGCAPDLVDGSPKCGAVFPAGNVNALTQVLHEMLSSPDRLSGMRTSARERVSAWGFDQDIAGLRAALESVAGR